MGKKYLYKPTHKGYNDAIRFLCDYCKKECWESKESFGRKNRHFCSSVCYSKFRKEILPLEEQPAYNGIRKQGESKQVYHRNYCRNHPENISHLKSIRYARERGAEGSHSFSDWQQLKIKHKNRCAICGENKPLTKDHILPLSEGGSNYIDNIQPLCRNCNSKKWKHIYENPELLK